MKIVTVTILMVLLMVLSHNEVNAQQIKMSDTLRAKKAIGKIMVDGKMDEMDWQNAPKYGLAFWKGNIPVEAPQKTEIKMLWSTDYLYFFINATDKNVALENVNKIGDDDIIEIMLNLVPKASDFYFQFQFNCGTKHNDWVFFPALDGYRAEAINAYSPEGILKASVINGTPNKKDDVDKGYTLEIAIPLSAFSNIVDFNAANPINTWKIQFARFDRDAGDMFPVLYSTSEMYSEDNPHYPKKQKFLKFVE